MSLPPLPPRYTLGPLLGEGAMGRVYRATDVLLDAEVAIKLLRAELAGDPGARRLFDREVRLGARVVHPHIVPLHDLGSCDDGTPFLAMAWADSGSLLDHGSQWEELKRLVLQVLDGLAALHARGIVHQDLKPANVLVHRGQAWIADLGMAQVADLLARGSGRLAGTPEFMAPEQRQGRRQEIGPATDLFAVGAMLDRLSLDMDVPDGLEGLIEVLTHPDPLGRYDLAADAARALAGLGPAGTYRTGGGPSTAAPPTLFFSSDADWEAEPVGRVAETPKWNRPAPGPMPPEPPGDASRGARARASLPLFAMRQAPLVARDAERALLWRQAREVTQSGRPRVVVLVGDAGSGKSRLVESVVGPLQAGGWMESAVLRYHDPTAADDGAQGAVTRLLRPYGGDRDALQDRLERAFGRDFGPGAALRASLMCRWAGLLREGEAAVPGPLGLSFLWDWMRSRAWRGGTCLWLEDVQWAGPAEGLSLARSVLDQAAFGTAVPVLVLATLRGEDLADDLDLQLTLAELVEAGALRLDLERLDQAGTLALLDACLALDEPLARTVAARCEGNPLFALQLLQHWTDQGHLVDQGGLVFGLHAGIDADRALPPGAAALFETRLQAVISESLDPVGTRTALQALALAGRTVPRPVAEQLTGAAVRDLEALGLLRAEADEVGWRHTLMYAAAATQAEGSGRARRLHAEIARAWSLYEATSGQPCPGPQGLHLLASGQASQAVPHLLQAGRRAHESGRAVETVRYGRAGVEAADSAGSASDRAWARRWLAQGLFLKGELLEASEVALEAEGFFEEAGDARGLGGVLRLLGILAWRQGDNARGLARQEEALRCFQEVDDRAEVARTLAVVAEGAWRMRDLDRARSLQRQVLAAHEGLSLDADFATFIRRLGIDALRAGDLDEAHARHSQALAMFSQVGDRAAEGMSLVDLGRIAWWRGDLSEAERYFALSHEVFLEVGAEVHLQESRMSMAEVARRKGDYALAEQAQRSFTRWSEARGHNEKASVGRLNLGLICLATGRPAECLEELSRVEELLASSPDHWWLAFEAVLRLVAHVRMRNESAARQALADVDERDPSRFADAEIAGLMASAAEESPWPDVAQACREQAARLRQGGHEDLA